MDPEVDFETEKEKVRRAGPENEAWQLPRAAPRGGHNNSCCWIQQRATQLPIQSQNLPQSTRPIGRGFCFNSQWLKQQRTQTHEPQGPRDTHLRKLPNSVTTQPSRSALASCARFVSRRPKFRRRLEDPNRWHLEVSVDATWACGRRLFVPHSDRIKTDQSKPNQQWFAHSSFWHHRQRATRRHWGWQLTQHRSERTPHSQLRHQLTSKIPFPKVNHLSILDTSLKTHQADCWILIRVTYAVEILDAFWSWRTLAFATCSWQQMHSFFFQKIKLLFSHTELYTNLPQNWYQPVCCCLCPPSPFDIASFVFQQDGRCWRTSRWTGTCCWAQPSWRVWPSSSCPASVTTRWSPASSPWPCTTRSSLRTCSVSTLHLRLELSPVLLVSSTEGEICILVTPLVSIRGHAEIGVPLGEILGLLPGKTRSRTTFCSKTRTHTSICSSLSRSVFASNEASRHHDNEMGLNAEDHKMCCCIASPPDLGLPSLHAFKLITKWTKFEPFDWLAVWGTPNKDRPVQLEFKSLFCSRFANSSDTQNLSTGSATKFRYPKATMQSTN